MVLSFVPFKLSDIALFFVLYIKVLLFSILILSPPKNITAPFESNAVAKFLDGKYDIIFLSKFGTIFSHFLIFSVKFVLSKHILDCFNPSKIYK